MAQLRDVPGLVMPIVPEWADPVWHLFVVRHAKRDLLQQKLTEAGIGTLIHYPVPSHLTGAYAEMGWKQGSFPIAEELSQSVLSLPMGPQLEKAQAAVVIRELVRVSKALES
jgi:dTDP-4-amino-4,6-dideoxygalactose transaminase